MGKDAYKDGYFPYLYEILHRTHSSTQFSKQKGPRQKRTKSFHSLILELPFTIPQSSHSKSLLLFQSEYQYPHHSIYRHSVLLLHQAVHRYRECCYR